MTEPRGRETSSPGNGTVSALLLAWSGGDRDAFEALIPLVYREMRDVAARELRGERQGHSLHPTELVHEAFLKLLRQDGYAWQNRAHFIGVSARAMRRILVDHARRANAQKRPSPHDRVPMEDVDPFTASETRELLVVHEALEKLGEVSERQARLIELRYFAGFTIEETAEALEVSVPTVVREWRFARAWIKRLLSR